MVALVDRCISQCMFTEEAIYRPQKGQRMLINTFFGGEAATEVTLTGLSNPSSVSVLFFALGCGDHLVVYTDVHSSGFASLKHFHLIHV